MRRPHRASGDAIDARASSGPLDRPRTLKRRERLGTGGSRLDWRRSLHVCAARRESERGAAHFLVIANGICADASCVSVVVVALRAHTATLYEAFAVVGFQVNVLALLQSFAIVHVVPSK